MSLEAQFFAFAASVSIGIAAGFLFDSYRVARITLRLGRLGTGIGDLLIWVALTFLVFGLLLLANWGEVRWYILLGLGLGAVLYYRSSLSRGGKAFWRHGFRVAGRTGRLLASPFAFVWRLTARLCRAATRPVHRLRARPGRQDPAPPAENE